jgi:hypothetical protein
VIKKIKLLLILTLTLSLTGCGNQSTDINKLEDLIEDQTRTIENRLSAIQTQLEYQNLYIIEYDMFEDLLELKLVNLNIDGSNTVELIFTHQELEKDKVMDLFEYVVNVSDTFSVDAKKLMGFQLLEDFVNDYEDYDYNAIDEDIKLILDVMFEKLLRVRLKTFLDID